MLTRRQIPNLLTFGRVAAVPISLALMVAAPATAPQLLLWIFVAASITDFFDGYLARKWNAVSPIGAMLDPVADKLLVALMLVYLLTVFGNILFLPVVIILLRELYISGLREFLSARGGELPVSKGGKWKTALQMGAVTLYLFFHAYAPTNGECPLFLPDIDGVSGCAALSLVELTVRNINLPAFLLLWLSAILALTSAFSYTRAAAKQLVNSSPA